MMWCRSQPRISPVPKSNWLCLLSNSKVPEITKTNRIPSYRANPPGASTELSTSPFFTGITCAAVFLLLSTHENQTVLVQVFNQRTKEITFILIYFVFEWLLWTLCLKMKANILKVIYGQNDKEYGFPVEFKNIWDISFSKIHWRDRKNKVGKTFSKHAFDLRSISKCKC